MRIIYHPSFQRALKKLPLSVRGKFEKQVIYLMENIRHPSLRAKKYDESSDLWQARVDGSVRFYFFIEKDSYTLVNIRKHR